MAQELLKITDLSASADEKEILNHLSLSIGRGETHVIMGPNGAGKSTLASVLMGDESYEVTGGTVEFDGEDIGELAPHERAKKGIFMSFQNPIEVPGISLENFIKTALELRSGQKIKAWDFRKEVKRILDALAMDPSYAERDLNVGFSGGEKKKAEILQMLLLKPRLAVLDETDSGLDVDAVRTVSKGIEEYQKDEAASLLIITHNAAILSALSVDAVHILVNGKIVKTGGKELIDLVAQNGFSSFEEEQE
ncbi:MAG: Fe-S cluster assembly ATPase SufC [Lachnospiraceae bacterium]|nr:Fe-S cluster assembly ATPase SufC [Lachnospiraceae bacterium]